MAIDVLDKLVSAKMFSGGQYFENPGKYRVAIEQLVFKEDARNGPTFIAETKIVSAEKTGDPKLRYNAREGAMEQIPAEPHAVGTTRSYVQKLDNGNDSTYGNMLKFLYELTGLPETYVDKATGQEKRSIDKAGVLQLCGKDQPAKGWLIDVVVYDKPQKKDATKVFTNLKWSHVPRESASAQ